MSKIEIGFCLFYDKDFFTQSNFDFDYGHQSRDKQNCISQTFHKHFENFLYILCARMVPVRLKKSVG